MQANEFFGASAGFGQSGNRQRRRVGRKHPHWIHRGFRGPGDPGFQISIFEDRFDDQVTTSQLTVVRRGMNAAQNSIRSLLGHAASLNLL